MDRPRLERCLQQVAAYRASGQKASQWARDHGVPLRALSSWCAHAARWRARLEGTVFESAAARPRSGAGFVAAAMPTGSAATVRVEVGNGATATTLHWPLSHAGELAALLREVAR